MGENADEKKRASNDALRTVLAGERTLAAWMRTSLSAIGGGLLVTNLPEGMVDAHIAFWTGVVLVGLGMGLAGVALYHHIRLYEAMHKPEMQGTPYWAACVMVGGLFLVGGLVMAMIFIK